MKEYKSLTKERKDFLYLVLDLLKTWHMSKSKMTKEINRILTLSHYDEHDRRYLSNEVTNWYKRWIDIDKWYYKNLYNKKFYIKHDGKKFKRYTDGEPVFYYDTIVNGEVKIGFTYEGKYRTTEYYMKEIVELSKKDWVLL